jgi:hypothetical protein
MVRLVNLLMRDEGPDTAIEPIDEEDLAKPESQTALVSADGVEVKASTEAEFAPPVFVPVPRAAPAPQVDSEDEDEMLLEV